MTTKTTALLSWRMIHHVAGPDLSPISFARRAVVFISASLCASIGIAVWIGRKNPGADVGSDVLPLLVAYGCASVTSLMGCVGEFAVSARNGWGRLLMSLPLRSRAVSVIVRAPAMTAAVLVVGVVNVPAAKLLSMAGYGSLRSFLMTFSALIVGAATAPVLVWSAQSIVTRLGRGSLFSGIMIALWLTWSAASAYVLTRMLKMPIGEGPEWWMYPLTWPALSQSLEGAAPLASAGTVVALLLAVFFGVLVTGRLSVDSSFRQRDLIRHERRFGSRPVLSIMVARALRNTSSRSHLTGAIVACGAWFAVGVWRRQADGLDSAVVLVSLFVAMHLVTRRNLDGPLPLELRIGIGAGHFGQAWVIYGGAVSLALTAPLMVFSLAYGLPTLSIFDAASVGLLIVSTGCILGSWIAPRVGDSSAELTVVFGMFGGLFLFQNLVGDSQTTGVVALRLVLAIALAACVPAIEVRRWKRLLRANDGAPVLIKSEG